MHGPGGIVAPSAAPVYESMVPSSVTLDYGSERMVPFSVTGVHVPGRRASSIEVGMHGPTGIAPPHPHDSITNLHEDIPSGSMTIDI